MNKIISVANLKGGCAKTTTAHSIASLLGMEGYRVLVIDADPQGTLTFATLGKIGADTITLRNVLLGTAQIQDAIIKTENFKLIPATLDLSVVEINLSAKYGREFILKNKLEAIKDNYDYIIIDCPPSIALTTVNALVASTHILIPCECELFAIDGMRLFMEIFEEIKELNPSLKILGVVPTKLDNRRNLSKEALEHLQNTYNCTNPIHINSKLAEIGIERKNITELGKSRGLEDYQKLVKNFIE